MPLDHHQYEGQPEKVSINMLAFTKSVATLMATSLKERHNLQGQEWSVSPSHTSAWQESMRTTQSNKLASSISSALPDVLTLTTAIELEEAMRNGFRRARKTSKSNNVLPVDSEKMYREVIASLAYAYLPQDNATINLNTSVSQFTSEFLTIIKSIKENADWNISNQVNEEPATRTRLARIFIDSLRGIGTITAMNTIESFNESVKKIIKQECRPLNGAELARVHDNAFACLRRVWAEAIAIASVEQFSAEAEVKQESTSSVQGGVDNVRLSVKKVVFPATLDIPESDDSTQIPLSELGLQGTITSEKVVEAQDEERRRRMLHNWANQKIKGREDL